MRMLVADHLHPSPLEELELLGAQVEHRPDLKGPSLQQAAADANILVVRSTPVTREVIDAAPRLGLIVRAGAGVNTIDVEAASARGIYVANCPGKNAAAVAELTMGLVLALDRRLVDATVGLRAGRWEKAQLGGARGIFGQRLGIAGLGSIGLAVLERARGFGLEVSVWSRSLNRTRAMRLGVIHRPSLLELASHCDILSLHLPLTDQTQGIVDAEVLEAMPEGATLINTCRAGVVDYAALREVAPRRRLRVGLDVFAAEPRLPGAAFDDPTMGIDALVYGTPHIAASTEQAQDAIAREVARIVRAYLTREEVPNVVNVCRNTPARYVVIIRMLDKVGVLAHTLNVIKRHGINVEECSNTVFEGAQATCTKLRVSTRPSDICLKEILAFEEVLYVDVIQLPNLA